MTNTKSAENATEETKSTPPWGDDFDAEKAWRLIEALRADKVAMKEKLDAAENSGFDLVETRRELYVERALRKHPGAADLADFLSGETEEEILAKAERLAKASMPPAAPEPEATLPAKPKPALLTGHGATVDVTSSVDSALAAIIASR
ncbi:hypothetical protein [Agromyces laixinhei]|uniref:hypothetical protein n=1 Tax=Agromyces laixinhei TaxID=2585717 RepID=UPI0012EDB160|nr:hypothetical protein [Agromyces laixinhei]